MSAEAGSPSVSLMLAFIAGVSSTGVIVMLGALPARLDPLSMTNASPVTLSSTRAEASSPSSSATLTVNEYVPGCTGFPVRVIVSSV